MTKTKKDAVLIITEKPQAALKIASALADKAPRKYSENHVSFYELEKDGKKIIVASAVGHIFNLTYVKGQTGWPIFEIEWVPSYRQKHSAYTKNYYTLLKKLSARAKEIIIATDYDTEGEVIGWNVLRFICKEDDAKRMKYSTLTKPELIKSYEHPLPHLDWGQAYAGETRHVVDWLYGINLSRALMSAIKTTGSFKILSIGRVQGPALKTIVDREREIAEFKSEPYWQVFAIANNTEFKHPKDIFNKDELKEFEGISEAEAETKIKEESIEPPHPFDLTSLQRESYNLYKISPSKTLQIAQALYLDGIISYPRTSSQKIPQEIEPKKILKKLAEKFPQAKYATRDKPVEGSKSDPAHPSIYPTGEFKALQDEEKKLYELIVKRFISCFCQNAITDNKRIKLTADNGKIFTASALVIKEKGWLNVYPKIMNESNLPDMSGKISIEKIRFDSKMTQPPKRYTPASLVSILEKKNLGTKATRSMIIDTLFDRGYLDGKSIQATPLGLKLIETLEKHSPIIIDENLTKELEEKMQDIQESKSGFKEKYQDIVKNVERLIGDISKEFKASESKIGRDLLDGTQESRAIERENNTLMPCPVCKKGHLAIKYSKKNKRQFVACDQYPNCTATYSLPPGGFVKKTEKVSEDGLPILISLKKGKKPWEFPFDPNWKDKQNKDREN
ncbi:DNA topoisomerase I [Candidatus Pacearchaeota archaeon CG1_02_39_14]|nr:MAG: DNA topoisomerase I [Candidatus Pacearchaeota archaeon CG1_02_39_14]